MRSPLLLVAALACAPPARSADPDAPPLVPLSLIAVTVEAPNPSAGAKVRPFRLQPGFLAETPWLSPEETPDPNPDGMTLGFGNDNPHLDFRRRGEPGGVGYSRLASQVALFDAAGLSCTLYLGAVTPAGADQNGLPDSKGPTVLMPALSLHHSLDEGMGVQMSVGGNWSLLTPSAQAARREWQYGVSLYRSLGTEPGDPFRNIYLSVEATAQGRDPRATNAWELLPGLTWKPAPNWTLSGAVAVPVRAEAGAQQWRITCTLQF
ncbi:MAG: hypothetical protein K2W96_02230 [Gemmataceae bacterium]|nr:hypothetical protein [Gemmataceae bacterium]